MRKTKRLKPILTLLLAMVMVLGLIPVQPAAAADKYDIPSKPWLIIQVKVGNGDNYNLTDGPGSDSTMAVRVNFVDGSESTEVTLDNDGNDFEAGTTNTYWFQISKPYWMISSFDFYIKSYLDRICVKSIIVGMTSGNGATSTSKYVQKEYDGDGVWLTKSDRTTTLTPPDSIPMKRWISYNDAYQTFIQTFSKTVYLDESTPSSTGNVTWTPRCDKDDIYNPYNPFDYDDAPDLKLEVFSSSFGSNAWVGATSTFSSYFTKEDKGKGFTYNPTTVYNAMGQDYIALRVDVTLEYPARSSYGTTSRTVSYYIYRKQFGIKSGEVGIDSSFYTAQTDNYFFNKQNSQIKIKIPVQANVNYSLSDLSSVSGTAKLFYGTGSSDYLAGTFSTSGGNIYVTFTVPSSTATKIESGGVKLLLQGVKAKFGSEEYPLFEGDSFTTAQNGTLVARTETLGGASMTLGLGAYYQPFSKHKIDNLSPEN